MKKTLLASALMLAFSANALAAINGQYQYGEGETLVVDEVTQGVKRLLGGSTSSTNFKTGSIVVNVGNWDYVFGGSYLDSATQGEQTIGFESTSVTINSTEDQKVTAMHVVGGTGGNDVHKVSSDKNTTRTASLTINGGEYGVESKWSADTLENLIVGGDHFKNYAASGAAAKDNTADVHLKSANTVINDATVNSLVIGGSLANQYYPEVGSGVLQVNVGTANTTISNSTINKPIVAGGVAMGINAISNVGEANLTIENSKVNDRIFAGGVVRYGDPKGEIGAKVGQSTITIKDSAVKTIENGRGFADYSGGKWDFIAEDDRHYWHDVANDTETTLNLVNSTAELVDISKGKVNLRAEGAEGGVTVTTATIGDGVVVSATADGAFNDSIGGNLDKAKEAFKFGNVVIDTVKLEEGEVVGAVTEDGVMQVNKKTEALAKKVTLAPQMITRIMMSDLRKRMGDVRAGEGTHGAWARYNGGQMAGDGVDADFHMVQVGIDTVPVVDAPRFGVAFSYAQTESEDGYGTTDMDSYSLAFYGMKMYDNGMFVDVIGRMATMDTDMVNAGNKAKMDNVALSLSGELGWRFDVTDRFFFEPSVEATYTYTNADTFTMGNGTYELEATDSLIGRAGFAAGFKCPANKGDVYVRAAVVHEFMGDETMNSWTAGGTQVAPVVMDGKDTWFEYAIGAQFNVNKNTYVYTDVERTEGAAMDEDWRANVGVRFAF